MGSVEEAAGVECVCTRKEASWAASAIETVSVLRGCDHCAVRFTADEELLKKGIGVEVARCECPS